MSSLIRYISKPHPITGVTNAKLGTWCFLASEVMLFGALFSSYLLIRTGAPHWPRGSELLNVPLATLNTLVLITSSVTMVMSWASLAMIPSPAFDASGVGSPPGEPRNVRFIKAGDGMNNFKKYRFYMASTILLGLTFLVVKGFEYGHKFSHHHFPSTGSFYALYFTLTGLHGFHVLGGILLNTYFLFPGSALWSKEPEQFTGRIECAGLYWHFVDLVWIFLFPVLYLL